MFYKLSRHIGDLFRTNRFLSVLMQIFNTLSTFVLILVSWILFRAPHFSVAKIIFHKIIFEHGRLFIPGNPRNFVYSITFLVMLIVIEFFEEFKLYNGFTLFNNPNQFLRRLSYISVVIMILMFGVFDSSQFIYFQF